MATGFFVLVRFDHGAGFVVNADHGVLGTAVGRRAVRFSVDFA
jgi:hypothetical protein